MSIASTATNAELYAFAKQDHPDTACGLTQMLNWNFLVTANYVVYEAKYGGYPWWPVTEPPVANPPFWAIPTSTPTFSINSLCVGFGATSVTTYIPYLTSAKLATVTNASVTTNVLTAISMFSFKMLYNQLAIFRGVGTIGFSDKIQQICIDAVNQSNLKIPLTAPLDKPTVGLQKTIEAATASIVAFVAALPVDPDAANVIIGVDKLSTLIPRMFKPYWELRYYSSFQTGGIAGATFYDQRYAELAVANAFDQWVAAMVPQAGTQIPATLTQWLLDARANIVDTTEGASSLRKYFDSNRKLETDTVTGVTTLQSTNNQFSRRQGSVGSMSESLDASRRRTNIALATLLLWIATLVTSVAVSAFLIKQKDYPLVLALIIATITLLTVDSLGRAVVGLQPSPYSST